MLICIDVSHTKTDNRLMNNILFKRNDVLLEKKLNEKLTKIISEAFANINIIFNIWEGASVVLLFGREQKWCLFFWVGARVIRFLGGSKSGVSF